MRCGRSLQETVEDPHASVQGKRGAWASSWAAVALPEEARNSLSFPDVAEYTWKAEAGQSLRLRTTGKGLV